MNIFTFQQPYEGNSCVGIFTYVPIDWMTEQREWIMVPGQTYYCSFRANAGFGGNLLHPTIWLATDHIGMLFTTYDRHWDWGDPYPAALNVAHIQYPQVLADTANWTLVSGSFLADSAYTYLMIGNFFSNALTDTVRFADPASVAEWYDNSYTLIDAVCVSPNPNGCPLAVGMSEHAQNSLVSSTYDPARGILLFGLPPMEAIDLDLFSLSGQRTFSTRLASAGAMTAVPLPPLATGIYVLRLRSEHVEHTVRLVVQSP